MINVAAAQALAGALVAHHQAELNGTDQQAREAVSAKIVALLVLAFDAPAQPDAAPDYDDAIVKLRAALRILKDGALIDGALILQ